MTSHLPTSLSQLRGLFSQAAPPTALPGAGDYLVTFVGPAPLKAVAPRAIALGGMPGWRGKRLSADGTAINLVAAGGNPGWEGASSGKKDDDDNASAALHETLPMRLSIEDSWLDGRPAIVCSYCSDSPVPWRWVRDEFRPLDDQRLIGLTFAGGRWSAPLAAPLLLTRS